MPQSNKLTPYVFGPSAIVTVFDRAFGDSVNVGVAATCEMRECGSSGFRVLNNAIVDSSPTGTSFYLTYSSEVRRSGVKPDSAPCVPL